MAAPWSRNAARPGPERDRVGAYYDYTVAYYRRFWHGSTAAVHYGFRGADTRGAASELLETNRFMADLAGIGRGERVLDAGCGVGGSCLWLARHRGARVVGVSLSRRQLADARARVRRAGLEGRISLQRADYRAAPFASGSFDVFWALESSCYAEDKEGLAREAMRLLRPGGCLVIADGFLRRRPRDPDEEREYAWFRRGLVLPDLCLVRDLERALGRAGFVGLRSLDKTGDALPSGRRMHRMCRLAYPVARLGRALGLTGDLLADNIRAGIAQLRLIRAGVALYGVVCATRPPAARPGARHSSA